MVLLTFLIALIVVLGTFILRSFVRLFHHKAEVGVDHWFWKAYIEAYRRDDHFPPILSQYLLDEHQWYPPFFPLLLARVPARIFDHYSSFIAVSIDLLRLGLVMVLVMCLKLGNSYWIVALSGAIYALTPMLIHYNVQLNPRGLGALFLDLLVVLMAWWYLMNGPFWVWIPVLLLSGLVLLTHKMTTQLFWFLCMAAAFITMDWRFLTLVPISILVALILSKGFYWNVLKAHWDIVTFWNRNWRWLQAHSVKESPIYGEFQYETPTRLHRNGWGGVKRHLTYLMGNNPWAWLLLVLAGLDVLEGKRVFLAVSPWIWVWVGLVCAFSMSTLFLAPLKCLGAGHLYLYNVSFPVALLWGLVVDRAGLGGVVTGFIAIGFLLSMASIVFSFKRVLGSATLGIDHDFEGALDFLKRAPRGPVLCLPPQWYDVVAYKTGQPVLFGGHGYGFRLLEPIFPRLFISLKEIRSRYQARYLLTMASYIEGTRLLGDLPTKPIFSSGPYQVFEIR
jgi:hypothetical protein